MPRRGFETLGRWRYGGEGVWHRLCPCLGGRGGILGLRGISVGEGLEKVQCVGEGFKKVTMCR